MSQHEGFRDARGVLLVHGFALKRFQLTSGTSLVQILLESPVTLEERIPPFQSSSSLCVIGPELWTRTQHNFYSPSPKMCQSHKAQLSKLLSPSHSISIFAFLSSHASHIRLSPSKTDKCRTRKKQTTTTEILYTVPISKISMTILTVGRRGQSERGKSLCPMNLHGWKSGRERERENSQL
ncbi:unnamed protein product [Leuciscus chuanchicus]